MQLLQGIVQRGSDSFFFAVVLQRSGCLCWLCWSWMEYCIHVFSHACFLEDTSVRRTFCQDCRTTSVHRPYLRCQILKPSLVFLNRASYGRRRNNDVTSQEREVTMMLRHNLRTDAQICGKSASQASLFVRHGRGVNRVYTRLHYSAAILNILIRSSKSVNV